MNTNFQVIGLTRLRIKPESTAPEADAVTIRPSELLNARRSVLVIRPTVGLLRRIHVLIVRFASAFASAEIPEWMAAGVRPQTHENVTPKVADSN